MKYFYHIDLLLLLAYILWRDYLNFLILCLFVIEIEILHRLDAILLCRLWWDWLRCLLTICRLWRINLISIRNGYRRIGYWLLIMNTFCKWTSIMDSTLSSWKGRTSAHLPSHIVFLRYAGFPRVPSNSYYPQHIPYIAKNAQHLLYL